MTRYTTAYSSFVSRLSEIEILRRSAAQKERENPFSLRREINALCRGSLVLLCGHLEAYIKELGEIALNSLHSRAVPRTSLSTRIYYHISKDILDELKDTNDPEKLAGKMFDLLQRDLPFWSQSGPFPQPIDSDRFNKGFSNPAYRKIKSYFGRFGYTDYQHDLARHLNAQYIPITNMVDHLVNTRNRIAHGDPSATETPNDIEVIKKLIKEYCLATDMVFASWCGLAFCKIRGNVQ